MDLHEKYQKARSRRAQWESLWLDCYDHALPMRSDAQATKTTSKLYDATALDAVDQLAASLLGNLTPPWSRWFGLKPGPDMTPSQAEKLAPVLEQATQTMLSHFDRSNFAVEMHQSFLDLVVAGTASLHFEENAPGAFSAFKFTSVPLTCVALEEGVEGVLDHTFKATQRTLAHIQHLYPFAQLPDEIIQQGLKEVDRKFDLIEAVRPAEQGYNYTVHIMENGAPKHVLVDVKIPTSPFINFRWMKTAGEIYGRSPVMKALPDIKTANKVVELILKNASIAVTGIWQADDDGVLNPANIELKPGTIIPKAVGSQGLKALDMPGRFDISQIVLEDLRAQIRHALLADRLTQIQGRNMTATEVLERSSEMALLLGATYGRLQAELLTPLVKRAFNILRRRGEVPDIALDGRLVQLEYKSPLAMAQSQKDVQNILYWINTTAAMGAEAAATVNLTEAARYLGDALGVPASLIRKQTILEQLSTEEGNDHVEQ